MREAAIGRLAPAGQEQATRPRSRRGTRRPPGTRSGRRGSAAAAGTPGTGRYCRVKVKSTMAAVTHDGQGADGAARRAERRGEAEQAVGHHQEQGDEGLGHVLVRDQPGIDLQGQGQAAENGEGEGDPPGAADPVADPLQRGEGSQQDEFDQGDVGQDLRPVSHRVRPFLRRVAHVAKSCRSRSRIVLEPRDSAGILLPRTSAFRKLRLPSDSASVRSCTPGVTPMPRGLRHRLGRDAPPGVRRRAGYCGPATREVRMAQDWARPVVHWEIEADDPERQRAFYADLFNWQIGDGVHHGDPAGHRRARARPRRATSAAASAPA